MQIELTQRQAKEFITRACTPIPPAVSAALLYEPSFTSLFRMAAHRGQAALNVDEVEHALNLSPATGAVLYIAAPAIDAMVAVLNGNHRVIRTNLRGAARHTRSLSSLLEKTFKAGANAYPLSFDNVNEEAVKWAEAHAADLVKNISDGAKDTIRRAIAANLERNISAPESAKLIRAAIGLTERDATAVANRYGELMVSDIKPLRAMKQVKAYAEKLLRTRSLTLARTEGMTASNEGQSALWINARKSGLISSDAMKTWVVADPCLICAALEGETVPVDEDFSIGANPPAHPRCQCTMGLVSA